MYLNAALHVRKIMTIPYEAFLYFWGYLEIESIPIPIFGTVPPL